MRTWQTGLTNNLTPKTASHLDMDFGNAGFTKLVLSALYLWFLYQGWLHLHLGHSDAFIQSDLQSEHLSEERGTKIYRCRCRKDVHRTECQALTITRSTNQDNMLHNVNYYYGWLSPSSGLQHSQRYGERNRKTISALLCDERYCGKIPMLRDMGLSRCDLPQHECACQESLCTNRNTLLKVLIVVVVVLTVEEW